MDGVSDHPFRFIQKKYGSPTVVYTEFTSVEGVCHGAISLLKDFLYDETQRPVIAQIYGTTPAFFRQTALILCQLGFDGIDINMGCPAKNVAHSGAGAALIKTPELAQEIVRQTKAGVEDWVNGKTVRDCPDITKQIATEIELRATQLPNEYQVRRQLPVSVKTRIGYDEKSVETWIPQLLEVEPVAIALHGRTLKQQYGGQADWETIGKAASIVHQAGLGTLIMGNGDVSSLADAHHKIDTYGLDGVLIGRASMGNPYIFRADAEQAKQTKSVFEIALEHSQLFEATYQHDEKYNFMPMRKHLGWYVRDIANASQIRVELFQTNSASEVEAVFKKYQLL